MFCLRRNVKSCCHKVKFALRASETFRPKMSDFTEKPREKIRLLLFGAEPYCGIVQKDKPAADEDPADDIGHPVNAR